MPNKFVINRVVKIAKKSAKAVRSLRRRIRKDGTSRRIMKGSNDQAAKAIAKELYLIKDGGPSALRFDGRNRTVSLEPVFRSPDLPSTIKDPKLTYVNLHAKRSFRAKSVWKTLRENQESKTKPAFYTGPEAARLLHRFMTSRYSFLDAKDNRILLEAFGVSPDTRLKALGYSSQPLTPEERAEIEDYRISLDLVIRKGLFEESPHIPDYLKQKLRKVHDDYHRVVRYLDRKVEKKKSN